MSRPMSKIAMTLFAAVLLLVPMSAVADDAYTMMETINAQLAADGADYQLEVIEMLTTDDTDPAFQRTVFFSNRGNKQLGHDFVPGDPRRTGQSPIFWTIDTTEGNTDDSLTQMQTDLAIRNAVATWENLACSNIPQIEVGNPGGDLGVAEAILGFGGSGSVFADITHAGWESCAFFNALVPGGCNFILGVTFTFIFVDGGGPTDVDNNGKLDTAFREINYNDNFAWAIDGNFDVETVALHEHGHGLSQAHFGEAFRSPGNGRLHFDPRAVMNAAYSGVQQSLAGSDVGGHCSNWGQWPNN